MPDEPGKMKMGGGLVISVNFVKMKSGRWKREDVSICGKVLTRVFYDSI